LTSSSVAGNQWYDGATLLAGQTSQTYVATAIGNYNVVVTGSGCPSAASSSTAVTVNPLPATPAITPGGATAFCNGGSVTLTSSSASGNQWFLNGTPIGGASSQAYVANASGNYTVKVTDGNICTSGASPITTVAVNPNPNATITAPINVIANSTGNNASVASAGAGATYVWGVTGGVITAGSGTNSITFTAGGPGTLTLNVTSTTTAGCSDARSANVSVVLPTVTVTSVSPASGVAAGGTSATINGTGFASGASVAFGGTAATNVVVVSSIKITAKTPSHSIGSVDVTVTNADASMGTLSSGFLYLTQLFDPNNDGSIASSDIFYLVNFLFLGGSAPKGPGGMSSGDANGDGRVDTADIFYLVNFLFLGGPKPNESPRTPRGTAVGSEGPQIDGSISLGKPVARAGHFIVPVIMTVSAGSIVPQAMALRVHFIEEGTMGEVTVGKAGVAKDVPALFELSRRSGSDLSYLVSYDPRGLALGVSRSAVVAEIDVEAVDGSVSLSVDSLLTMLSDQAGKTTATVGNGKLKVSGTTIRSGKSRRSHISDHELN